MTLHRNSSAISGRSHSQLFLVQNNGSIFFTHLSTDSVRACITAHLPEDRILETQRKRLRLWSPICEGGRLPVDAMFVVFRSLDSHGVGCNRVDKRSFHIRSAASQPTLRNSYQAVR